MYIYTAIVFHKGLITLIKTNRGPLSAYPVWVRSWVAFFRFLSRLNASLPRVKYRIPRSLANMERLIFPCFRKKFLTPWNISQMLPFPENFPEFHQTKFLMTYF